MIKFVFKRVYHMGKSKTSIIIVVGLFDIINHHQWIEKIILSLSSPVLRIFIDAKPRFTLGTIILYLG